MPPFDSLVVIFVLFLREVIAPQPFDYDAFVHHHFGQYFNNRNTEVDSASSVTALGDSPREPHLSFPQAPYDNLQHDQGELSPPNPRSSGSLFDIYDKWVNRRLSPSTPVPSYEVATTGLQPAPQISAVGERLDLVQPSTLAHQSVVDGDFRHRAALDESLAAAPNPSWSDQRSQAPIQLHTQSRIGSLSDFNTQSSSSPAEDPSLLPEQLEQGIHRAPTSSRIPSAIYNLPSFAIRGMTVMINGIKRDDSNSVRDDISRTYFKGKLHWLQNTFSKTELRNTYASLRKVNYVLPSVPVNWPDSGAGSREHPLLRVSLYRTRPFRKNEVFTPLRQEIGDKTVMVFWGMPVKNLVKVNKYWTNLYGIGWIDAADIADVDKHLKSLLDTFGRPITEYHTSPEA
ncbi:hypothetical protein BCV70DRAFT_64361 [Testicularia cyperi]|uniref:Effector family protein Eff1 n=1 Tax=Testicularia cyperi TaxID=1882483 RepID=A0A317XH09_9BASI|nr:hypothetical protein BCV70DRAFT_64361 [Testicularia cyperi]